MYDDDVNDLQYKCSVHLLSESKNFKTKKAVLLQACINSSNYVYAESNSCLSKKRSKKWKYSLNSCIWPQGKVSISVILSPWNNIRCTTDRCHTSMDCAGISSIMPRAQIHKQTLLFHLVLLIWSHLCTFNSLSLSTLNIYPRLRQKSLNHFAYVYSEIYRNEPILIFFFFFFRPYY